MTPKLGTDGVLDWSNTQTTDLHDYCIEKWNIATVVSASSTTWAERCMKISIKGARPFETLDNDTTASQTNVNTHDIDLQYRKYSISVGWLISTAVPPTAAPGKVDFEAIDVDFATFLSAAALYDEGIQGYAMAGSALLATICAMSF